MEQHLFLTPTACHLPCLAGKQAAAEEDGEREVSAYVTSRGAPVLGVYSMLWRQAGK